MIKEELAHKIVRLCGGNADIYQLLEVLNAYSISLIDERDILDFKSQMDCFLGAKRTEGLSSRTIGNYKLYLGKFGEFICRKVEDITTNDIRRYISSLGDSGMQKSSIQSVINILRSFFAWLTMEEVISRNPMLRIKSFRVDRKRSRRPLTVEELERLRNACRDYREKALVEFLYSTGCRLTEAMQVDVNSIDFDRRTVSVVGKGDKERTLYYSVRARLMIQEYILSRRGGDALFAGKRKPHNRLGAKSIQKILAELGKRAGLSRRVHPHILRHTFATNALHAGMDITVIQQILGHSNVSTTQIYAKTSQEHVRQQHDIFVA